MMQLKNQSIPAALIRAITTVCTVFTLAYTLSAQPLFEVSGGDESGWVLQPTSEAEFLTNLLKADVVVIGERHGRKEHQDIEARLIQAFAQIGREPSIVLEMLSPTQMPSVLNHRQASPLDASSLGAALQWWDSGWPAWSFYEPVFQATYDANFPLFPADLDAEQSSQIVGAVRKGSFPLLYSEFTLNTEVAAHVRASWTNVMRAAHCNLIDNDRLIDVTNLQILRDQSMAFATLQALGDNPGQPAILIVGSNHARADRSVPLYLQNALPQLNIISMVLTEVTNPNIPQNKALDAISTYGIAPFTYSWQTKETPTESQCDTIAALNIGQN